MTSQLNVLLDVGYDWQRDNETVFARPDSECQTSANFMVADYVTDGYVSERAKANGMPSGVNWWALHTKDRGDTTNGNAHSRVWEEMLGIPSTIRKDGELGDIIKMLSNDTPVALGVHYKSSGHWIVAIGVDVPNKMFRCHDPYGSRAGASDRYHDTSANAGKADYYSFDLMARIWSCTELQYARKEPGYGNGWYRELPSRIDNPDLYRG